MDDGKVIWSKWQSLLTEFQPLFTRGGWCGSYNGSQAWRCATKNIRSPRSSRRWDWSRGGACRRRLPSMGPGTERPSSGDCFRRSKPRRRPAGVAMALSPWTTPRGTAVRRASGEPPCSIRPVVATATAPRPCWPQLGGAGALGARPAVDLPPRRRPAVYPPQCLAGRRDVLDEKPIGGGDASPGRPRRQSPAFGRAGWGFCPCQRAAALPESSSGRAADRLRHPAAPRRSFVQTAGDQTEESVLRGASTAVGPTPCQPEGPRAVERAVAAGPSLHLWPHAQFPRPTGLGPMGGHRQGPSGACLCLRGGRLPQTVVPDCSARSLCASQVVAAGAARFRQEDGFRDQKQRLGMEECRAWTKEPILPTFQVQLVAQALLQQSDGTSFEHSLGKGWVVDGSPFGTMSQATSLPPRLAAVVLATSAEVFAVHRVSSWKNLQKRPQARFPPPRRARPCRLKC